jgi:hypothetical protein
MPAASTVSPLGHRPAPPSRALRPGGLLAQDPQPQPASQGGGRLSPGPLHLPGLRLHRLEDFPVHGGLLPARASGEPPRNRRRTPGPRAGLRPAPRQGGSPPPLPPAGWPSAARPLYRAVRPCPGGRGCAHGDSRQGQAAVRGGEKRSSPFAEAAKGLGASKGFFPRPLGSRYPLISATMELAPGHVTSSDTAWADWVMASAVSTAMRVSRPRWCG